MANNFKKKMTLDDFMSNESPGLMKIFDFASNLPISLYVDTTAVKIPESCYSSSLLSKTHFLSETYLLNRKRNSLDLGLQYGVMGYSSFNARASIVQKKLSEAEDVEKKNVVISLPQYKNLKNPLGAIIRARRSIREMSDKNISLEELSTILFYGDGVTGEMQLISEEKDFFPSNSLGYDYNATLRSAPSGGGLFPIDLYLVIRNVQGLRDGIYIYMPLNHSLKVVRYLDEQATEELKTVVEWGYNIESSKINVIVFYVYNLYNNSRKYLDMALDFAMIESGQISENIHLVSTALTIASCDIGGFDKFKCEQFLGVDGLTKNIINVTILGN